MGYNAWIVNMQDTSVCILRSLDIGVASTPTLRVATTSMHVTYGVANNPSQNARDTRRCRDISSEDSRLTLVSTTIAYACASRGPHKLYSWGVAIEIELL